MNSTNLSRARHPVSDIKSDLSNNSNPTHKVTSYTTFNNDLSPNRKDRAIQKPQIRAFEKTLLYWTFESEFFISLSSKIHPKSPKRMKL